MLDFPSEWTSQPSQLLDCWTALTRQDAGPGLLLLCPLLERSMGDLLSSVAGDCGVPALLSDLLKAEPLLNTLGPHCVVFARILLGSPAGFNLRNLVWHGFVFPGEIHSCFLSAVFFLTTSIGHILVSTGVTVTNRSLYSVCKIKMIEEFNPCSSCPSEDIVEIARRSPLIYTRNLPALQQVSLQLEQGQHDRAVLLLLPLLETTVRNLFVRVNNCPQRLLTAESEALYTTFTEMFAQHLEDGESNELLAAVGDKFLTAVFDLLMLPEGPRVRDKISHGEIRYGKEEFEGELLSRHLLRMLTYLLTFDRGPPNEISYTCYSYQTNTPVFHPAAMLSRSIKQHFSQLALLCEAQWNVKSLPEESSNFYLFAVKDPSTTELSMADMEDRLLRLLDCSDLKTLFRPKKEYELLCLLQKIDQNISLCTSHALDTFRQKEKLLNEKLLRSRQRATYIKMLEILPLLQKRLCQSLCFATRTLLDIDKNSSFDKKQFSCLTQLLKRILKAIQNISSNVFKEKNKWDVVEQLLGDLLYLLCQDRQAL